MPNQRPHRQLAHIPDLLALVPHLLGFHPGDSGVVVGIRDERLHLVARLPLPGITAQEPGLAIPADATAAVMHEIADECAGRGITDLVVLGYGEEAPVLALFDTATAVFAVRGLTVMQLVRVTGARYIEHDRDQPSHSGEPTPFDPDAPPGSSVPGTAHQPAADRAALAASVAPLDGAAGAVMACAIEVATEVLDAVLGPAPQPTASRAAPGTVADGRRRYGQFSVDDAISVTEQGGTLDDAAAAALIVLLQDADVRNHAFARAADDESRHLRLWLDLTRRATPTFTAAPACLAAYAAWRTHQPMLARFAVDRALHDEPDNRQARLLDVILSIGLPPELADGLAVRRQASDTER